MSDTMNVNVMLADQINRLFEKRATREALVQSEAGMLPALLWDELEEMGVSLALVAEAAGGVGLSWGDVGDVWRAIGYHAAPVPLGETMIGRWALAAAGLAIPAGPLALCGDVLRLNDSLCVDGTDVVVPWASQADAFVAVAVGRNGSQLCLIRRTDVDVVAQNSISRIPCARLSLAGVAPVAMAPVPDGIGVLGLLPHIAALRAAQMGGCLDRLLGLCVEFGNTRVQFGKPIGKFQAIQHMIASLAEQTAAARVAGALGCRSLDGEAAEFGVAVAKIQAGQSAAAGAAIAHQVFGAMGVTDEHSLHFFTRRLWQWRDEAESEHWWAERIGRRIIDAGGAAMWPMLVGQR
jgi:acyl-CoA dehydrogenase